MPFTGGEVGVLIGSAVKAAAWFFGWLFTFISGVVTATWIVSRKLQRYEDRLTVIEEEHDRCRGKDGELPKLGDKIDNLKDSIDKSMEEKLGRVHQRIDDLYLKLGKK